MSPRYKSTAQRPLGHSGKDTPTADPQGEPPGHDSSLLSNAENALDECVGAISLVEVTIHSLDSQEIASPEQEVLRRALRALWSVHNWIYDRKWPDTAECDGTDQECQP